jgi:glycosidase
MTKRFALFIFSLTILSCNQKPAIENTVATKPVETFPEKIASATVYEVNIRQYSPEGTINAFTKDLPRLKDLGVQVLWIMPVQPIGVKNRKEPLGSYYSIRDYKGVNPEFGTGDDFKNLVKKSHELGMYIILDWVPNHTSWDNPWITEHPEYYAQDDKGNVVYEADWTDIALLNHLNPNTRLAMIDAMKYWVTNFDIDGFRCDHAGHEIPLYFWEEARAAIDPIKDLFWLAEWDGARMHLKFDATYAWPLLDLSYRTAEGKANANDIANFVQADLKEYGRQAIRLNMITNHDKNSWEGTEFEKFGDGVKTFATFIFTTSGMPMIYTGQEVGLDKRLKFFDKDNIDWSDSKQFQPFYKKLVALHTTNPALWTGEYGGMPVRINNQDPNVYAFKRTKDNNTVIAILNFTGKAQSCQLIDETVAGSFQDYFTGEKVEISTSKPLALTPWQYLVFVK